MNLPEKMTLQGTLESGRRDHQNQTRIAEGVAWAGRVSILVAVLLSPWFYGGVQYWAQFAIAVALLLGLAFWWFETNVNKKDKQVLPYILLPLAIGLLIGLGQLAPLPDAIGGWVFGRQAELHERFSVDAQQLLAASNEDGTAATNVPKRVSLNPSGTGAHLRLLIIAIAGLLLGCRFFQSQLGMTVLLGVITLNGVALTILGLLQQMTSDSSTLYWSVPLSQGGNAFASFVNRNNAGGYLLMCLAASIGFFAMFIEQRSTIGPQHMVSRENPYWKQVQTHVLYFIADLTAMKMAAVLGMVIIATGVMATLSRGSVVALFTAGIVTLIFFGMARKPKHSGILLLPLFGFIVALSSWVGFGDDLTARFENFDTEKIAQQEMRLQNWKDTLPAAREMGVFGSGLGSYSGVHRLYRTNREQRIFEFAENQYFQAWIEAGWPGLLLLLAAWLIAWNYSMILIYRGTSSSTIAMGIAGVFLVSSQAVASFFDFGFYIPSNTLLLSLLIGFLGFHAHSLAGRLRKQTWLRFQVPNTYVRVILLIVFAGVTMSAMDYYRKSQLDKAMVYNLDKSNYSNLDLSKTDEAIKTIGGLVAKTSSRQGLNYMGDLYVHRARLQFLDELMSIQSTEGLDAETVKTTKDEFWKVTRLSRMHETMNYLKRDVSQYRAARFLDVGFIVQNLPIALNYYRQSRQLAPLQPEAHKQIGKINALIGSNQTAEADFERAVELAPTNAELRLTVGLFFVQAGLIEEGATHLRRYLELNPDGFQDLMLVLSGRSSRRIEPVDSKVMFESVIPDDAKMLFLYAQSYLDPADPQRLVVLEKADVILGDVSLSDPKNVLLSGRVKLAKGDMVGGIEQFELALRSEPGDQKTKANLVRLYLKAGMLEKAEKQAEDLIRINRRDKKYQKLVEEVQQAIKEHEEVSNHP